MAKPKRVAEINSGMVKVKNMTFTTSKDGRLFVSTGRNRKAVPTARFKNRDEANRVMRMVAERAAEGDFAPILALKFNT